MPKQRNQQYTSLLRLYLAWLPRVLQAIKSSPCTAQIQTLEPPSSQVSRSILWVILWIWIGSIASAVNWEFRNIKESNYYILIEKVDFFRTSQSLPRTLNLCCVLKKLENTDTHRHSRQTEKSERQAAGSKVRSLRRKDKKKTEN